jgi:hypothetical protein
MPAVAQAVGYVRSNRSYEPLEGGDAAMVALRKVGEDERAWDFHRGFAPSGQAVVERARRALRRRLPRR